MMKPPETLETERLYLRKPVMVDATPIFEQYAQDRDVTRFLTWKPHSSLEDTKKFLQRCIRVWKEGTSFPWAIIRKSDNQLIGMIEIVSMDFSGALVGFVLAKPYWGKGYMKEALQKIIQWCLTQEYLFRVWAFCDVDNKASARVMKKAGMKKEGILRRWITLPQIDNNPRDCYCYAVVK